MARGFKDSVSGVGPSKEDFFVLGCLELQNTRLSWPKKSLTNQKKKKSIVATVIY